MVERNISYFTKKETRAWAGRNFPKVLTPLFSTGYVMLRLSSDQGQVRLGPKKREDLLVESGSLAL